MKKLIKCIIVILICFASHIGYSQPLFGYTPEDIKNKYPNVTWEYNAWGTNNELVSIFYTEKDVSVHYFFDKNKESIFTAIYVFNQNTLQALIEIYNKKYVIVDNYNWKFYNQGSLFECNLSQNKSNDYYFFWSVKE